MVQIMKRAILTITIFLGFVTVIAQTSDGITQTH